MRKRVAVTALALGLAMTDASAQMYGPTTPAFAPALPELRLAAIPEAARPAFDGNRVSYMEAGRADAPPLLLLHGIGANSAHWRFQYAALQDRYRVIGWNAPGYMLTDNLKAETPSCEDYAGAVAAFLDALGIGKAYVLGNSFGSGVAQCFAINHPQRVIKLALTGTLIGRANTSAEEKAKNLAAREASIAGGGMTLGLSGRDEVLIGSKAPRSLRPMLQSVLAATNPRGYLQATRFISALEPTTARADRLTMPLLLIHGREDRITPLDTGAVPLQKAVPGARLEILDGYGHLPEFENPEAVNALLADFFS